MLSSDRAALIVVDVQGKLAQSMHEKDALFRNLQILIRGAQLLEIPILWLEQNPQGLGPTVPEIASLLGTQKPIAKMTFSACGHPQVTTTLRSSGRTQVLLAGIEAHVCIYLTAADLLQQGYHVEVVADAVASRSPDNKRIGLARLSKLQAAVTCCETALFELLGTADHPRFRDVIKLLR